MQLEQQRKLQAMQEGKKGAQAYSVSDDSSSDGRSERMKGRDRRRSSIEALGEAIVNGVKGMFGKA